MVQVVEICPCGKQGTVYRTSFELSEHCFVFLEKQGRIPM